MKDYLKVYKAKILVMSPTFVGSGKDISKKEYRLSELLPMKQHYTM